VAVGLRKIAQQAAGYRVELLGKQTDIIAAREQTIEQLSGFRVASLQYVVVDEPEAACEKRSLARGKAIGDILGLVAQHEFSIDQQLLLDRLQRSLNARITGREKAHQGD